MADTLITNDFTFSPQETNGLWGAYWIDNQIGAKVFLDLADDLKYARTIDGGVSWTITEITTNSVGHLACWFDQETPNDIGNLIHIAYLDDTNDDAKYVNLNISSDTVGTIRTIDSTITVDPQEEENRIAITKTVGGNLLVAFTTQLDIECYRSVDGGVSWVDRANVFETATEEDWVLMYPANTADNNDACAIFWDRSADEISIKIYDDTLNTWTETSISTGMIDELTYINMDGAVRHSDKHVLLVAHSDMNSPTDDLRTWDINPTSTPTITPKSNVVTNQDNSGQCAILINQQNNDVYVAHLKGTLWEDTVHSVYHKSVANMDSWGVTPAAYNQDGEDDFRLIRGARSIGTKGGRVQWSLANHDTSELIINLVNDIPIFEFVPNVPLIDPTKVILIEVQDT